MYDAFLAPSATAWTTATAANTSQTVTTAGYDTVIVTLVANASLTGGGVIFEVYDGATWLPVKAPTIIDYTTVGSVTLSANYSKGFQVPVAGFPQFRTRLSSVLTGASASVSVTTIVSSAPDVSLVTVGLDPAQPLPAGTNTLGAMQPAVASLTDRSTTVGTSAALMIASNATRTRLVISNPDPANDLWVAFNGLTAAVNGQGSIRVAANGGTLSFTGDAPTSAVSAIGLIASQKTTAWEG
jgi:hypothetical protein